MYTSFKLDYENNTVIGVYSIDYLPTVRKVARLAVPLLHEV